MANLFLQASTSTVDTTTINEKIQELLPPVIDNVSGNILAYAVILAAIATITMALLELCKAVLMLKYFYNKTLVKGWMTANQDKFTRATMSYLLNTNIPEDGNTDVDILYDQLIVLAVSDTRYAKALFDQDTDKVMGQLQAVANIVLDYPQEYPDVYFMLTNTTNKYLSMKDKISKYAGNSLNSTGMVEVIPDNITWMQYAMDKQAGSDKLTDAEYLSTATQARARLEHVVARKLDALQAKMTFFWARLNQGIAIVGSIIFLVIVLSHLGVKPIPTFFLSVAGGMMAPFAKDVVSALSGLRSKA